jgi:FkbM family methyltransferase
MLKIKQFALRIILKCIKPFNFHVFSHINKKLIKIPFINGSGISVFNHPENWFSKVAHTILMKREGAFIDVGTNMGQTLLKIKTLMPDLHYFGFEPNINAVYYIKKLITANSFLNCEIYPFALSNKIGTSNLLLESDIGLGASIIEGFRQDHFYRKLDKVFCLKGDSFFETTQLESLALIKLNVEGSELEVIKGLWQTISKFKPYIICEILPVFDATTKEGNFRKKRQDELIEIIQGACYTIFRILGSGDLVELDTIEVHADVSMANYLFVPQGADGIFRKIIKSAKAAVH